MHGAPIQESRLIRTAGGHQHGVQRIEIGNTRHRNQVVVPEVTTFAFNATFLMTLAGCAELGGKTASVSGTP